MPYLRFREVPQPEIVAQETSTHILQCEAGGSPTPTIHWLKNGKKITQVIVALLHLNESILYYTLFILFNKLGPKHSTQ